MKVKRDGMDTFFYTCFCILSLGSLWVLRLVISHAIRCSVKDEEKNEIK